MLDLKHLGITVYRGFPSTACYVWSPFVIKLETRFRFAGQAYKLDQGSPLKSPRGKIPYIAITTSKNNGESEILSDSQLISEHLTEQGIFSDLNGHLSPAESTIDLALRALLEDKLYFYNAVERWLENYYTIRDKVMAVIPYPIRILIGYMTWRKVIVGLHFQGTGRYSTEEIDSFRSKIWHDLDNLLAESRHKTPSTQKLYWALGGKEPTEADTTLFGFTMSALLCDAGPKSQRLIRSLPNLVDYARRIHEHYFPDYEAPRWE